MLYRRRISSFLALLGCILALSSSASAHYLWVAVDASQRVANIYFEESPAAGDGHYLDPFVKASTTWIRTVSAPEPRVLATREKTAPKKRWLSAELEGSGPRSIDSYGKFGVYAYGETKVLLHYYARYLDVSTHEDLHELARAEQMKLDIVPHDEGKSLSLTVLWNGERAVERPVYVRGPGGFKQNLTTDARGRVRFDVTEQGTYTFRTSVEEPIAGRDGDEDYSLIRHNATLVMRLPLEK